MDQVKLLKISQSILALLLEKQDITYGDARWVIDRMKQDLEFTINCTKVKND